ncbi:right-handed parallel beta-helix repeat-containing protein [Bacillus massilinigeriensis]|uniref:right-handed parallel beta-helix repeat-containing protein n=1 Tax=Bacillus massilionigeriensis TaxID=1805475 RepID=UPI000AD956C8|nr:right-handed parallel beta-helix repeat-containing protein [Bacillus massilionigeriensis]
MIWKFKRLGVLLVITALVVNIWAVGLPSHSVEAASKKIYTISATSKPINKKMLKYSTYNKYTKQYYLIRSYLEKLEKAGGGTLVLKKGTYTISNVLYVPSNVTIKMKNGVKMVKGTKTGTKKFSASKSIFQLIRPSKAHKKGVYGKYNGEKNITIQGEGTVTIDLKYIKDSLAIIMGHNQNVLVENIHFKNMYSGHFIEMDASKNVEIFNNSFTDSKVSPNVNKEAINLDTPDKSTNGWSQKWSKYDKTPNENVFIEYNIFDQLDRAVGTHKYSEGKYHENVVIRNNSIMNTRSDAIRVMNWSNPIIEENTIENVADGAPGKRGVLASGVINPIFQNNVFNNVGRTFQFIAWKNTGSGAQYDITYNILTDENKAALQTNKATNVSETIIRINNEYNEYRRSTEIVKF